MTSHLPCRAVGVGEDCVEIEGYPVFLVHPVNQDIQGFQVLQEPRLSMLRKIMKRI
jgi:hypothetical protein